MTRISASYLEIYVWILVEKACYYKLQLCFLVTLVRPIRWSDIGQGPFPGQGQQVCNTLHFEFF